MFFQEYLPPLRAAQEDNQFAVTGGWSLLKIVIQMNYAVQIVPFCEVDPFAVSLRVLVILLIPVLVSVGYVTVSFQ
jgi:hypothetical protein